MQRILRAWGADSLSRGLAKAGCHWWPVPSLVPTDTLRAPALFTVVPNDFLEQLVFLQSNLRTGSDVQDTQLTTDVARCHVPTIHRDNSM